MARPITCQSISLKILNKIISNRYAKLYNEKLYKDMHAYRSGKSTWTALAQLLKEIERRQQCLVCSLDISKAFDSVPRHALQKALDKWNLPAVEMSLIIAQYTDCDIQIELNGKRAKPFAYKRGIRQGCALSGLLWDLVMAEIYKEVEVILPITKVRLLSYADDIIIIADTKMEIQVVKKVISDALQRSGLLLDDTKESIHKFDVQSTETTTMKWLKVTLAENLTWDQEVITRTEKAKQAMQNIKKICRQNNILLPTKIMVDIIKSLVAVYFTTGDNVIPFTKEHKRIFQNLLQEAIHENTNIAGQSACKFAEAIIYHSKEPHNIDTKRNNIIQSVSSSSADPICAQNTTALNSCTNTPGESSNIMPPEDTTTDAATRVVTKREMRLGILREFQDLQRWCELCQPRAKFLDLIALNLHRKRRHNLPDLDFLDPQCPDCRLRYLPNNFLKHKCKPPVDPAQKEPCPFCCIPYFPKRLGAHVKVCPMKIS